MENKKIQRKAIWYRNIAASVILIAFVSIYFNVADRFAITLLVDDSQNIELSSNEIISFESADNNANFPTIINDVLFAGKSGNGSTSLSKSQNQKEIADYGMLNARLVGSENIKKADLQNAIVNVEEQRKLSTLTYQENIGPNTDFIGMINQPEELEKVSFFAISEIKEKKDHTPTDFQANVLFGSGNFNPNSTISEGNSVLSTAIVSNTAGISSRTDVDDAYNERQTIEDLSNAPMRSNLSLTYGLNFGFNLGKRMLVKSGISYGNFRSTSESSAVLRDVNSNELFPYHGASSAASAAEGKVINITSPYNLYNDFEILSIPLQLSYKLIDSKFDLALMTGATADFLLSNAITGASDQLNTITFTQQDKSAYKQAFASGVIGVELSYELGRHYGVSLTPQYKKALTDVTSNGVGFSSSPAFASVNMSFQYIF